MNIAKYLREPILKNICKQLVLSVVESVHIIGRKWLNESEKILKMGENEKKKEVCM